MNQHWTHHSLGDLFEIARGGSPRPIENYITDDPDGLNWIKIGDATGGGKFIERTKEKIRPEGLSKTRKVNVGDFLLTNSMSFGRPYIMATDGCIHDGWLLLRPRNEKLIDRGYFYHLLSSELMYSRFASRASGSTVKNLNTEIVASVQVQLPTLDEQRRIAAILDQADGLRQKRKRAIALLDSLMQSIFLEMFGDLIANGTKRSLRSLVSSIDYGVTESAVFEPVGPRFLRITDIQEGRVDWNSVPYCAASQKARNARLVDGDIVFARTGATTGKSFLVLSPPSDAVFASYLIRVRPGENLLSQYLFGFFQTSLYWRYIAQNSRGAAQGGVNATTLGDLEVPLASMESQIEYSKSVRDVAGVREFYSRTLLQEESLFASLQHRAFSGQL